jgi:LuxR family maltose regulon positive regulatory protein
VPDEAHARHGSSEPEAPACLATLVNALRKKGDCRLFIDDIHLLGCDALRALCQLIDRSPASMRFVLASRAIPDMPLARMRARGQLLELGVEELKFNAAEAQQFLACTAAAPLSDAQVHQLLERTEGWVTGIRLASLVLKKCASPDEMLASLTGSRCAVADFFAEEVLAALPPGLREFLLQS